MTQIIDKLIINSPYKEPQKYCSYNRERRTFHLKDGRRPAGYVIASQSSKSFDDPGIFVEIELVNKIRPRVKKWVDDGYQGILGLSSHVDCSSTKLPEIIEGIVKCFNPNCITNHEAVHNKFHVVSKQPVKLRCHYCERLMNGKDIELI